MCAHQEIAVDWRNAAAYAPLLQADRSFIAWEWIRRDPVYRAAATQALSAGAPQGLADVDPQTFGLVSFEPPALPVPFARPMWRSDVHPFVLHVERASDGRGIESFDINQLPGLVRLQAAGEREHLLLSDGLRAIRLDAARGTFSEGPVRLRCSIEGVQSAKVPLLVLRRFVALAGTGRFARSLHPREACARRWMQKLRAFDALSAGASLRDIATGLLRPSAAEPLWRVREPGLRSQAQRLARGGCCLAEGEYRRLLLSPGFSDCP